MPLASFSDLVPDLVVVLVAFPLAGLLLAARRWEAENVLLAIFLCLIGTSFAADLMTTATDDLAWHRIDNMAAALDPFVFLAFVTAHPYVRRTRLNRISLAWLAIAGATCATIAIAAPALFRGALAPARLLYIFGITGFGYAMCWFAAVAALRHAPTEGLARRARWACLAVGVAVVTRLPFVLDDFGPGDVVPALGTHGAQLAMMLAVVALAILPALLLLRGVPQERLARRVVVAVAGVATLLVLQSSAFSVLGVDFYHPLALRWIAFSGILSYAILAHQVIRFPVVARRVLPVLGAGILGIVAASIALAAVPEAVVGTIGTIAIAGGIGLAATPPGFWAARSLLAWAERTPAAHGHAERRLALYSAAVESAIAGGTLERLAGARRHLGLSRDEARVVEDLVRRSLRRSQPPLRPGDEPLPGIVVERPLPGGSQAHTFLARQLPSGGAVVVKQLAVPHPDARRRLWKELDAMRSLRHPCIPRLVDFTLDPAVCIAYEHVPGPTLAEALHRGPLPPKAVASLARDLLSALEAVHAAGFVHGDVKPANIVLAPGRAHLIDFGLAEASTPPRATLDGDGRIHPAGTLDYMSPELAHTGKPTAPADLFALGIVLHEALTGHPARSLRGLAIYQALERIERDPVGVDKAPARWQPFLEACLDPDPSQRARIPLLRTLLPEAKSRASVRKATAIPAPQP